MGITNREFIPNHKTERVNIMTIKNNLVVILQDIAASDEIESEVHEMRFEHEGRDTGFDVDIREVCKEASNTIEQLRKKLSDIAEIAYAEHDPDLMGDALHDIQCIC